MSEKNTKLHFFKYQEWTSNKIENENTKRFFNLTGNTNKQNKLNYAVAYQYIKKPVFPKGT